MHDPHDPRYLIAGYVSTLVGGHPEDSLPHADAILAALRDEYGAIFAEIEIESPAPDPNTVYVRKVQKRIIPVPEGSAS